MKLKMRLLAILVIAFCVVIGIMSLYAEKSYAHQVGAHLVFEHSCDGEEHGQGNDEGRRDGGLEVPQDQEQDDDDQQRAFDQVLFDGRNRCFD